MAKRTVLATRATDGHLQLLEPVDLPLAREFPVTLDLPEEQDGLRLPRAVNLPTWPGRVLGPLRREEIYDDVG